MFIRCDRHRRRRDEAPSPRFARTVVYGIPDGHGVKVSGAGNSGKVLVEHNTFSDVVAGVGVGWGAQNVVINGNIIAGRHYRTSGYDAAVHAPANAPQPTTKVTGNLTWGFPKPVGPLKTLAAARNVTVDPKFDKIGTCTGYHPKNPAAANYGRYAQ